MRNILHYSVAALTGVWVLGLLIWGIPTATFTPSTIYSALLFGLLIVFTLTFGVPLAGGMVSLVPMTIAAAYLTLGQEIAGWTVYLAIIGQGIIRYRRRQNADNPLRHTPQYLAVVTLYNAAIQTASMLGTSVVFTALGGNVPLLEAPPHRVIVLILAGLTYLGINYTLAGIYFSLRGATELRMYLRSIPNLFFYEGSPLIFAPLMALIHNRLGIFQFVVFALALVVVSLIAQNLALTSRRLQRRVQELDSLQAVGQVLSASLDIEIVTTTIYEQVARLMSAKEFYIALYDPELDEVSFPLAIENSQRIQWRSRQAGNGLTEYVLRQRVPILLRGDISKHLDTLELAQVGRSGAACWLGVPILAAGKPLGILAVQSYTDAYAYDLSHQEILTTIAAQAAVAIQNARLYAQTDETLARRVQELNSILRTTREGILLLDLNWRVLAANRALAELIGVTQLDFTQQTLETPYGGGQSLLSHIHFTAADFQVDCQTLMLNKASQKQDLVTLGPLNRHVERTLTPVRDRANEINGWLLIFRDITEEIELARLRDDMTNMLIHDLRSPLTMIIGSLGLLQRPAPRQDEAQFNKLLTIASNGSNRMLDLINQLLDISKLESGQLVLNAQPLYVETLFSETILHFALAAAEFDITLTTTHEPQLPPLQGDGQLLARVLNNLVDNALKFTPDGGRVTLKSCADPLDAGKLLIMVSDTGPGIPPEVQPRLFEKFQQIAVSSSRRRGTGLGLAFCKLAVEAHGGRIWVESAPGQGSTFIISLPIAPQATPPATR